MEHSFPLDPDDHIELIILHNDQLTDEDRVRLLEEQVREIKRTISLRERLITLRHGQLAPRPDQRIDLDRGVVVTMIPTPGAAR